MRDLAVAVAIVGAYMALLVAVAAWAERAEARGRRVASNALVYALSMSVYATTWTFYGSVGFAARSGVLFLTVYLGPTLCAILWWWVLRRLVRIKAAHRVTGLPDLLALRYERSHAVALLATVLLVVGLVPYLALQLKTLTATLAMVSGGLSRAPDVTPGAQFGVPLLAFMLLFTVVFGLRRLRPTERHPGLMVALAAEGIVKLAAFTAAGAFVAWGLFHGPADVLRRAAAAGPPTVPAALGGRGALTWVAHLLLSGFAILLLPRQFHVAVVENSDEDHVRTAMWLFPAYLVAINLFVLPIALGGVLLGRPVSAADELVLALPLAAGRRALSWLVFLGGFSAGTGMVVVETTALATMIANHVVLPAADGWEALAGLRRRVRGTRWVAAAAVLAAALGYERGLGAQFPLASIGFVSFAAVLQLAPALLGGLWWRKASRAGAMAGLAAGFATWAYTLVVPVLARSGWIPASILTRGPFGIELLVPEGLFDLHLEPVTHAVVWSLAFNVTGWVLGSLLFPARPEEAARVARVLDAASARPAPVPVRSAAAGSGAEDAAGAPVAEKRARARALLARYHGDADAARLADACLAAVGATGDGRLGPVQLAELQSEVETTLAAAIGSAAAHAALRREPLVTPDESAAIARAYADILAGLQVSPAELQRKIDYHRERERLLAREAEGQRFLASVSGLLGASLDLDAIAATAVRLPVGRIADGALLAIPRGRGRGEEARAWIALDDPAAERGAAAVLAGRGAELGGVLALRQALAGRRVVVRRPVDLAAWPPALAPVLPAGVAATLPLLAGREVPGTLTLFAHDPERLRPDDLGVAEELAHRVAIALENARLYRDAEEAVRARDEFLAVASHELKTPLTPLRLKLQTIERLVARGELASIRPERLVEIFGGAEALLLRLVALVDDLLDVTRITTHRLKLRPEELDLSAVVREVVERHAPELVSARCEVRVDAPAPVRGRWDRIRIEQVVTNLLMNAAKYAPGARVRLAAEARGGGARLVVSDDGPGIAPEDQERIFRPFERAARYLEVSGFGLGLFIVQQVVEAHGGTVRLDSQPGEGATFTIELPDGAAERASGARGAPPSR